MLSGTKRSSETLADEKESKEPASHKLVKLSLYCDEQLDGTLEASCPSPQNKKADNLVGDGPAFFLVRAPTTISTQISKKKEITLSPFSKQYQRGQRKGYVPKGSDKKQYRSQYTPEELEAKIDTLDEVNPKWGRETQPSPKKKEKQALKR